MEPHDEVDRFFTEVDHLDRILPDGEYDEHTTVLALSVAKRGRSALTLLIKALASHRDQLQSQEDTST
jgi:hypothetical protein